MSSRPSAETLSRLAAVLAAAGQPTQGHLRRISPGLWRWTRGSADLGLKLFDGPNADERLRTEAALYRSLDSAGAPVPKCMAEATDARGLARAWVSGTTLYEQLRAAHLPSEADATAVWNAWLELTRALVPWDQHVATERHQEARRKRRLELTSVARAAADAFPTVPASATHALSQTVAAGALSLLPLDASPSNIITADQRVTFIDLELLGLDFEEWTFAKYVTAVDETGTVRTLDPASAPPAYQVRFDAAVTLLALARAAGLWGSKRLAPAALAERLPGRSQAAMRIRPALRLE